MVSAETVAVGAVLVAALTTLALLAVERPPVNGLTVLATGPWMVVVGLLDALAGSGAYPPLLTPLLEFPVVLVVGFVVAGVAWVPLLQLATMRDFQLESGRYLAAAGLGVAIVLLITLLVREGLDGSALLWLSATPLLAVLLAGTAYVLLGFVDPTTLATTRWVGFLVVFGFTLLGTVTAVAIDVYGRVGRGPTATLVTLASELPTASASVGWPAALLGLLAGCVVATLVARAVRADATTGHALAVAVAATTVAPSVARLLETVLR